ncbi:hypothetical protein SMMN14_05269 [Sphaerulina musiva]
MLCSQPIPCQTCSSCAASAARSAPRAIAIAPRNYNNQWFTRSRQQRIKAYQTETRLQVPAMHAMSDEAALATFNELRRLQRTKVTARPMPTRCQELRKPNSTPFRLLDLPAEMRVRIWEDALQEPFVLRLRSFATPALARTSRQLRQECLPIWFATNTFVAEVKSTLLGISVCASHGPKAEYIAERDTRFHRLGSLDLSPIVNSLLATCPPRAIRLKNIDFCMLGAGSHQVWQTSGRYAVLSVRDGRPVRVTTHVGGGTSPEFTKHVLHVFKQGKAFLEHLVADSEFEGLYMLQIKEVAAAFRTEPLPLPVPAPAPVLPPTLPTLGSLAPVAPSTKSQARNLARGADESRMSGKLSAKARVMDDVHDEFDLPQAETYFS